MSGLNSNVTVLLHFDGQNASQYIHNAAYNNLAFAVSTGGRICTSQYKFGSAAIVFTAYHGVHCSNSPLLNMQDTGWMMDFWVRFNAFPAAGSLAFFTKHAALSTSDGSQRNEWYWNGPTVWANITASGSVRHFIQGISYTMSLGSWYHCAFGRCSDGMTHRMVCNGSIVLLSANSGFWSMPQLGNLDGSFWIGCQGYQGTYNMFATFDEFRVQAGVPMWDGDYDVPTEPYSPDLPVATIALNASNVQPLWVQNEGLQIANRFRYDAVRKIPDMSAAQVRAVLMSAGYVFNADNDHDFTSIEAHSIASVRLYPTITEDDNSDVASVYFSDVPWNGSASTVGMIFTVAKDFVSTEYNSKIVLLLHGEGSDGGTTFLNSASNAITVTAISEAITAISAAKWGNTGMRFVSDGLSIAAGFANSLLRLSQNDWTIHFWIKFADSNLVLYHCPWTQYINASNRIHLTMISTAMNFHYQSIGVATTISTSMALTSWGNTSWYHICATRSGTLLRLYKDGSLVGSGTITGDLLGQSAAFKIGRWDNTQYAINGYIDEFVFVKSAVLWTSTFTPPTSAELQGIIYSGETIIGFLSVDTTIPEGETLTAKGVSLRLT